MEKLKRQIMYPETVIFLFKRKKLNEKKSL